MYYLNKIVADSCGYSMPVTIAARQTMDEMGKLEIELLERGIHIGEYQVEDYPGKVMWGESYTKEYGKEL